MPEFLLLNATASTNTVSTITASQATAATFIIYFTTLAMIGILIFVSNGWCELKDVCLCCGESSSGIDEDEEENNKCCYAARNGCCCLYMYVFYLKFYLKFCSCCTDWEGKLSTQIQDLNMRIDNNSRVNNEENFAISLTQSNIGTFVIVDEDDDDSDDDSNSNSTIAKKLLNFADMSSKQK